MAGENSILPPVSTRGASGGDAASWGMERNWIDGADELWSIEVHDPTNDEPPRLAFFDPKLRKWFFGAKSGPNRDGTQSSSPGLSRSKAAGPVPDVSVSFGFDTQQSLNTELQDVWMSDGNATQSYAVQGDDNDWTRNLPTSDHSEFFRRHDWASTDLGPLYQWTLCLRLYTCMLFSDCRPAGLYWGPRQIVIYNEAILPLIGSMHPSVMGQGFRDVTPSLWEIFRPMVESLEGNMKGVVSNGLELPIIRHGYLEETWWDGGVVPLRDNDGSYAGFYFSWIEVTRLLLRDRRTTLIRRLNQLPLVSVELMWHDIHNAMAESPRDVPMAMLYAVEQHNEDTQQASPYLNLKYAIGLDTDDPALSKINISNTNSSMARLLQSAQQSSAEYLLLDLQEDKSDLDFISKVRWQGHGEPSRHLIVMPLRAHGQIVGHLILGLNPRRAFDCDHEQFVGEIAGQLKEMTTRITAQAKTKIREQQLLDQVTDHERRIARLVAMVPIGIYEMSAAGALLWANQRFFDILGVAPDRRDPHLFDWKDYIHIDDQAQATEELTRCVISNVEISNMFRMNKTWLPPTTAVESAPAPQNCWILYTAVPDLEGPSCTGSLMGHLSDITNLKWTQQLQIRLTEKAETERRNLEDFIDVVSHEMRNPLSAIMQCADSVASSVSAAKETLVIGNLVEAIEQNAEAADSILFCANHQKRIIDDVLTLGKLGADIIMICPILFEPRSIVEQAVQMFNKEMTAAGIDLISSIDEQTILPHSVPINGDPNRISQVLINLLTNSIKFTRTQTTRRIVIRSGTLDSPPSSAIFGDGFEWQTTSKTRPDLTEQPSYGEGEVVYSYFAITDSGQGIPAQLTRNIFSKFDQGDRKTHIKYGGSGLGLHISRELTEMQGGRIGLQSKQNEGSTFAFYIKARKASPEQLPSGASLKGNLQAHAEALTPHSPPPPPPPPASATRRTDYTILLVEDNLLNQKILAQQLRKAGCTVHTASHGGEAVDFVLAMYNRPAEFDSPPPPPASSTTTPPPPGRVDCILMDWEMPVCDGLRATQRIREVEKLEHERPVRIVGTTANARSEQQSAALAAGMDLVVAKPFRVVELLEQIGRLERG